MIYRNDILLISEGTKRFRIIDIKPTEDLAWVIDLESPKALPKPKQLSKLIQDFKSGKLQRDAGSQTIIRERASAAAQARQDKMWSYISPLLESSTIYEPTQRCALIEQRADDVGCSPQTLYTALRRYWQNGLSSDALLPAFHKSGSKAGITGKRGRKPESGGRTSFQMTDEELAQLKKFVQKTYLRTETMTEASAYQRYLEKHHTYLDGNGKSFIKPAGERPSLRQFSYALNNTLSFEDKIRGRRGDKEFERNHRARLGSVQIDCQGIGHYYEIDATIADVFLVSKHDRSKIVGKPTMYLIFDRFSRLIVGYYIGLEAASWITARQAILSIAESKQSLCQRYGIDYDPNDWPAEGIFPQAFLADRGEMLAANSSLIVGGLNITVANLPSLRPDHKPIVECGFKQIHKPLADTIPGYEPPEFAGKRRTRHYDKGSCLTVEEFNKAIVLSIIRHNRRVMPSYPVTPEMATDGIAPAPRDLWAYNAERRMGQLTRLPEAHVRFSLLPQDTATVSKEGIYFKGCYYSCPEATKNGWFVRGSKQAFKLSISYDKRLVNCIYLHDPKDPQNFIQANLLSKSREFEGLTFDEVAYYQQLAKELQREGLQNNLQVNYEFHQTLDLTVAAAKEQTKKASLNVSRSARIKNKEATRKAELAEQRRIEAAPAIAAPPELKVEQNVIPLKEPRLNSQQKPASSMQEKLQRLKKEALNEQHE